MKRRDETKQRATKTTGKEENKEEEENVEGNERE